MPIFEQETPETIRARILGRMETELQTREGSYTCDLASPISFELWRWCMTLDELVTAFYVDENSGVYLDKHAALLALARKAGTLARAPLHLTGRDGTLVPAGTVFLTPEGLSYSLTEAVILSGGQGDGYLEAQAVGEAYNAGEGEISRILRSVAGLDSWHNGPAQGGADPESDSELFLRIDQRRKDPGTRGNAAHYREWALACDGVGACKVTGLWNGPGTVRVLLAGYDRQPVDADVVERCSAYIQARRPVGADVTVVSASGTAVDITARPVLEDGAELAAVQDAFIAKADAYLRELAFVEYTVVYTRIAALLMEVEGVADYEDLLVNGGTENLSLPETAVPVLGEVALS